MNRLLSVLLCLTPSLGLAEEPLELFEGQNDLPESNSGVRIESMDSGSVRIDGGTQADGGITIKFERQRGSIMVPATVQGKAVYFVFDTGATYTTLTSEFAKSANILPKKDYPTTVMSTANGNRRAQFGLMDRMSLGGRNHTNVTFSICDACPSGLYHGKPVVGLLGLNVLNRYRYSIDEGAGKIVMQPHSMYASRLRDIQPWLEIGKSNFWPDGDQRYKAVVTVHNAAPKAVSEADLKLECADGSVVDMGKKTISARGKATFTKQVNTRSCRGVRFYFAETKW